MKIDKQKTFSDKKVDFGYVIRTTVCAAAFILAAAYFSSSCAGLAGNYLMLINFKSQVAISWLIHFLLSATLFIVMLGVTAALIRPMWIAMVTYLFSAVLYIRFLGFSPATLITATVFVVILVLYLLSAAYLFGNQIKPSTHPLVEKKILVCSLLAALIAVSVGMGVGNDMTKRGSVIPPELKSYYSQFMMDVMKGQVDAQKATEKQKQVVLEEAKKNVNDTIVKMENDLKPFQLHISIFFGVLAFFAFQIVLFFVGILSMLLVPLLFWILKITHFTHTVNEKCDVTRLTLGSVS